MTPTTFSRTRSFRQSCWAGLMKAETAAVTFSVGGVDTFTVATGLDFTLPIEFAVKGESGSDPIAEDDMTLLSPNRIADAVYR